MQAIVLCPYSATNHSADYVVADLTEWSAYSLNARRDFKIHSRHASLDEASDACNEINGNNEGDNAA